MGEKKRVRERSVAVVLRFAIESKEKGNLYTFLNGRNLTTTYEPFNQRNEK